MQWYYATGKEKNGPFNSEEFNQLVINGTITEETLVWNKTFDNWQRLKATGFQIQRPAEQIIITPDTDEYGEVFSLSDEETEITERNKTVQSTHADSVTGQAITFGGNAGEFFRIWIVNLFLTIITIGIYAAWAKVRTKQYFYANTRLDGEAFDYLASPMSILKGNLIIAAAFILFQLSGAVSPGLSIVIMILFICSLPFLVYKSLCFNARNTAYRNIRFKFNGTLKESYTLFMFLPILFPFTMGLIAPYWQYRFKKYIMGNYCFGSSENEFTGKPSYFYEIVILGMGLTALIVIGLMIIFGLFSGAIVMLTGGGAGSTPDIKMLTGILVPVGVLLYIVLIAASVTIKTFVYVKLANYCFDSTTLGNVKVKSDYKTKGLLWIRISNIPAILFSVGLLAPWAMIRTFRYKTENVTVFSDGSIDRFTAADGEDVSAIGDSASDFFDMEIGL